MIGHFSARYSANNRFLGSFKLRADSEKGVAAMMDEAVKKIDALFQSALSSGRLRVDATLILETEIIEEQDLDETATPVETPGEGSGDNNRNDNRPDSPGNDGDSDGGGDRPDNTPLPPPTAVTTISVQIATPTPDSVNRGEGALRSVPGVRSASTSSLALGGTSVIRVVYQGDPAAFRSALQARGWKVSGSGGSLRISR